MELDLSARVAGRALLGRREEIGPALDLGDAVSVAGQRDGALLTKMQPLPISLSVVGGWFVVVVLAVIVEEGLLGGRRGRRSEAVDGRLA